MNQLLLLGGTTEGPALAALLDARRLPVVASLAGVTRHPAPYPVPVRTGGFGGIPGLIEWLNEHRPPAVIDATHPFASQMQANAAAACAATVIPRVRVLRPPWPERPRWRHVANLTVAAQALPPGARVLLTTGHDAAVFRDRTDCRFLLRTIEPAGPQPPHIAALLDRPPFTIAGETALMRDHEITHLVTKNSGGSGTAKLRAAEALGVEILVVDRPTPPPGPVVHTLDDALVWLDAALRVGN
ncbi:MAG: cobalt-precorrin-6A reductase [Pseudomonadota bacterium]